MRHAIQCQCGQCGKLADTPKPKPDPVAKAKSRISDEALFAFGLTANQYQDFQRYIDRVFEEEGITQ